MVGRWFMASINAMVIIGPALVWLAGAWLAIHGGVTVGTIVAFVGYLGTALHAGVGAGRRASADRQRAGRVRAHLRRTSI